jgi:hypothetical protein
MSLSERWHQAGAVHERRKSSYTVPIYQSVFRIEVGNKRGSISPAMVVPVTGPPEHEAAG